MVDGRRWRSTETRVLATTTVVVTNVATSVDLENWISLLVLCAKESRKGTVTGFSRCMLSCSAKIGTKLSNAAINRICGQNANMSATSTSLRASNLVPR